MSLKSYLGHNINLCILHHQGLLCQCQACLLSDGTSAFCKAKWSHYIALTNKFAKTLFLPDSLDVDVAYQNFCSIIKKAAKKTIHNNIFHVWMPSVHFSIERSCSLLRKQLKFGCYSFTCQT